MAHFLPPEHVRQVNKLEWPKTDKHFYDCSKSKCMSRNLKILSQNKICTYYPNVA